MDGNQRAILDAVAEEAAKAIWEQLPIVVNDALHQVALRGLVGSEVLKMTNEQAIKFYNRRRIEAIIYMLDSVKARLGKDPQYGG